MESILLRQDRLFPSIVPALALAQLARVGVAAVVVPVAAGALLALASAVWLAAAGAGLAAMAAFGLSQLYPAAVGLCAVAVLSGDALVEVQDSMPVGFRAVQSMRAALLLVGAATGALVLFAPLEALGLAPGGRGWVGAVSPVVGAAIMVLVAFAATTATGTARSATLVIVATWLFFALVWDPNVVPLAAQRGVPLLVALVLAACAWRALGVPGYVRAKQGGDR